MEDLFVCGGCNAKIGSKKLQEALKDFPKTNHPNLLVGFDSADDAGVWKVSDDLALIQTLDFFPPLVADPRDFGRIAATNAVSDVYAMGGDVLTGMNILCFPETGAPETLRAILEGGREVIRQAGGVLLGGHSIHDPKPKYGVAVTGAVHPDKIWKNNTPQKGDYLIFTKALGTGIITGAYAAGAVSEADYRAAISSMTTLNKAASEIGRSYRVHAATDVTGFGLIGHLLEMLGTSYTAVLEHEMLPILPGAYQAAADYLTTSGGQRNRLDFESKVSFYFDDPALEEILYDPQTSGGLLFAVDPEDAGDFYTALSDAGVFCAMIGQIEERKEKHIEIY